MILAVACTSDPKVANETLPSIEGEKIAEATPAPTVAAPSPEEIAAAEAAKVAEEKAAEAALKAAKKKT